MADYARYAVYYTPVGELAAFGAAWLGWDVEAGREVAQPDLVGLDLPAITEAARRYGFHATMKAPFRLALGTRADDVEAALAEFCATEAPVVLDQGLILDQFEGFLALTPAADSAALQRLAMGVVEALDRFRAPPTEAETARRRPETLTSRQRELLDRWGYPYVGPEFRFHMTLTGPLDDATADRALAVLQPRLAPLIRSPLRIDALSLLGEDEAGRFALIARAPLSA